MAPLLEASIMLTPTAMENQIDKQPLQTDIIEAINKYDNELEQVNSGQIDSNNTSIPITD